MDRDSLVRMNEIFLAGWKETFLDPDYDNARRRWREIWMSIPGVVAGNYDPPHQEGEAIDGYVVIVNPECSREWFMFSQEIALKILVIGLPIPEKTSMKTKDMTWDEWLKYY